MTTKLSDKISYSIELGQTLPEVPAIIKNNLSPSFKLRPYQTQAFSRFLFYFNNPSIRQKPSQLLFQMATGSGKTLIMAGLILYLYEQGYRNFLFFVNSTNIINKTKDNFLNPASIKYLFSESINIGGKQIEIKEVDSFQASNEENINIVFTTIQGLHSRLNTPRENALTYDDFIDQKIVLISDEAHHINADTKKKTGMTKELFEEVSSWEGTVNKIFRSSPENILLEFTATVDLSNEEISNKYHDKILFDYSLKQFRLDGYSKEVKVLEADIDNMDRALQACLLSQFRRKIFEKNKLHIKPVVLFKSKIIKESVFVVDMLNEGWDVLNLFDIVRLYNTRDKNSKTGQIGKTTISEAQLIGRGARYCPFALDETTSKFQRKFDQDIENELRICEELYYHSSYNPKYIHELNEALHEIGIKSKESKDIQLELKPDFKESAFYKKGLLFLNQKIKNDRNGLFSLPTTITKQIYKVKLHTGYGISLSIFNESDSDDRKYKAKDLKVSDFDLRITRKALNKLDFFQFNNLKAFLPNLKSISEFIQSDNYLNSVSIEVQGSENSLDNLSSDTKLQILLEVLDKVSQKFFVWGMPFYNEKVNQQEFVDAFSEVL